MSISDDLYEQLAAIEHERWSDWQRYVHGLCKRLDNDSLVIPAVYVMRWERQIATPYTELSEAEKQSDRVQVDRYWPLVDALRTEVERLQEELDGERNDNIVLRERHLNPLRGELDTIRRIVAAIPEADEPKRVADKVHVALMATTGRAQQALGEVLRLKAQRDKLLASCDFAVSQQVYGIEEGSFVSVAEIRAIYAESTSDAPSSVGGSAPHSNATRYRVGRSVGRTLYDNNILFGMVDTAEQAEQIVGTLNAAGRAVMSDTNAIPVSGRLSVEVVYIVGGTTHRHLLTARQAGVQLFPDGRGNAVLVDGADDKGPVRDVLYAHAEMIVRRPA